MSEIRIPGEPVAKQRPRRGRNGSWYTPTKTRNYEHVVAWTWRATRIKPISGPVAVSMFFYVGGRDKDIDNMAKSVMDGLNGTAYADDRQVVRMQADKILRPKRPGFAVITVEAL